MIELKAELMKKKKEYEESKKNSSLKPVKQTPMKPAESTTSRSADKLAEEDLKKSREALEAKARLYEKLERGKLLESELNASQRENLLVDFAWKGWNPEIEDFEFESDSSDSEKETESESEKSTRNRLKIDQVFELLNEESRNSDDRWIEYEDEFGRIRVAKVSQLRQIQNEREEVNKLTRRSINSHYDGDAEIRNKGVGFYRFDYDETGRQKQMRELRALREETVEKRMRTLLIKEQRRLRIESRLAKLKERKSLQNE